MSSAAEQLDRRRKAAQAVRARRRLSLAVGFSNRKRAEAERSAPPAGPPAKGSALYRLRNQISRQQYEAGCRLRDDWHGGLDCKTGDLDPDAIRYSTPGDIGHERLLRQAASRAAFDRASEFLLRETDLFIHNRVVTVCIGDQHPEDMARRLFNATGCEDALTRIVGQLRQGLDVLGRHYARSGAA